jgi:DNA-binding response OmpR family regulator
MKLMLTLGTEALRTKLEEILKPLAVEPIVYRHIQKAMDNIEEIAPDAIIIDAVAFPRQWKSFVQFIREPKHEKETKHKKHCPVILVKGRRFSPSDKNKAVFLGVDAIINDSLAKESDITNLLSIIHASVSDSEHKLKIENICEKGRFGLLITHPVNGILLSGTVKTVSEDGLDFCPDQPALAQTISLHEELPACSFRAGDMILSPVLRLVKREPNLYFTFVSFPGNEQKIFTNYYARTKHEPFPAHFTALASIP